jgi:hypothetical protein
MRAQLFDLQKEFLKELGREHRLRSQAWRTAERAVVFATGADKSLEILLAQGGII